MHKKQWRQPIGAKTGPQLTASKDMKISSLYSQRPEFDQQFGWGWRVSQVILVVKNSPASAGNAGGLGSIPGSERSPGIGNDTPLQYSCLDNCMGRGAWWAIVHAAKSVGYNWSDLAHIWVTLSVNPSLELPQKSQILTWPWFRSLETLSRGLTGLWLSETMR